MSLDQRMKFQPTSVRLLSWTSWELDKSTKLWSFCIPYGSALSIYLQSLVFIVSCVMAVIMPAHCPAIQAIQNRLEICWVFVQSVILILRGEKPDLWRHRVTAISANDEVDSMIQMIQLWLIFNWRFLCLLMLCLDMLRLVFCLYNLRTYDFSLIDRCLAKGSPGCSHPASSNLGIKRQTRLFKASNNFQCKDICADCFRFRLSHLFRLVRKNASGLQNQDTSLIIVQLRNVQPTSGKLQKAWLQAQTNGEREGQHRSASDASDTMKHTSSTSLRKIEETIIINNQCNIQSYELNWWTVA